MFLVSIIETTNWLVASTAVVDPNLDVSGISGLSAYHPSRDRCLGQNPSEHVEDRPSTEDEESENAARDDHNKSDPVQNSQNMKSVM